MIRSSTVKVAALAVALSGGGIAVNCSKGSNGPSGTGKVSLAFALPSGAAITDVAYDIKAGAPTGIADVTGHINTTDPNSTPSVEHQLPGQHRGHRHHGRDHLDGACRATASACRSTSPRAVPRASA